MNVNLRDAQMNIEKLLSQARSYESEGAFDQAASCYHEVLALESTHVFALTRLGVLALARGNSKEALVMLKWARELAPTDAGVISAWTALQGGNSEPVISGLIEGGASSRALSGNSLNILFLQNTPCIRNYKMATALRSRGHRVSLGYTANRLSQRYPGLSDDTYDENIHITSYRQLWDISKNYDLIHSHNEPDDLTVAALAGDCPVIHDTHDLISLRANGDSGLAYFEGIANRGADGRIATTPFQEREINEMYGPGNPSLVFYNYASQADLPKRFHSKLSARDGETHFVYEGGLSETAHRDFRDIFVEMAVRGVHVHIYPASWSEKLAVFFGRHKRIHYYKPVSPKVLMEEMTRYDIGIIPWNLEKGNKRFLDSTIANKLFEYLAAGLPVATSCLQSYEDFFARTPVGVTFDSVQELVEVKVSRLMDMASNIDFSKHVYTFENEIHRVEEFYHVILKNNQKRKFNIIDVIHQKNFVVKKTNKSVLIDLNKTQWLPNKDLIDIQNFFLNNLIQEVRKSNQCFRDVFQKYGLQKEIKSIDDLKILPIIDKSFYYKNKINNVHNDFEKLEKQFTGTGGSTGQALQYWITPEVQYYGIGCRNRGFRWAGFDVDVDKVVFFAGGSLGVTDKIEIQNNKLMIPITGVTNIDVLQKYYKAIVEFQAKFMRTYPSAIYEFCNFLNKNNYSVKFESVVTTAETLFPFQRELIEKTLSCRVFNEYGAYDGGAGAFECEYGNIHLQMERGIIELVDDNGDEVDDGMPGRVVVTDLHNYLTPFIRYDVGDIAVKSSKICRCGRGLTVISSIKGRSSDYIVLNDNTKISGEVIIHLFNKMLQNNLISIKQFQVVQRVDKTIDVYIVPSDMTTNKHLELIKEGLKKHFVNCNINVQIKKNIEISKSGKVRFVFTEIVQNKINHELIAAQSRIFVPCVICKERSQIHTKIGEQAMFRCNSCDLVFAYPMPSDEALKMWYSEEEKTKRWNGDLSLAIARNNKTNAEVYQIYFDFINNNMALDGKGRVLEVGCYDGLFLNYFKEMGYECEGLDLNEGFVRYGIKQYGLKLFCSDIYDLKYSDDMFDLIIFHQLLEHLNDPLKFINEVYRILKPGGRIVFSLPNIGSDCYNWQNSKSLKYNFYDIPNHVTYFSKKSMHRLLMSANFENIKLQTFITEYTKDRFADKLILTNEDKMNFNHVLEKCQASDNLPGLMGIASKQKSLQSGGQIKRKNFKKKPKICHIGGAHSVHVADIVKELYERGYEQCVVSYFPVEESITIPGVPVYHFPYRDCGNEVWVNNNIESNLLKFLKIIVKHECPDIVHGHSLTYSCVPVWMLNVEYKFPAIVTPWSIHTIKKPNRLLNKFEKRCLSVVNYLTIGTKNYFDIIKNYYKNIDDSQYVCFRPLLNLELYDKKRAVIDDPRILSVRVMGDLYRQDLLVKALPAALELNDKTRATFLIGQNPGQGRAYFDKMIDLAKKLNVYKYCTFIDKSLDKYELRDVIFNHNIVYALSTHDDGYSGSAAMSMYSGAITLIPKSDLTSDEIVHKVNALTVDITEGSIQSNLLYAIENLDKLQSVMQSNNSFLSKYTNLKLINTLESVYRRMC